MQRKRILVVDDEQDFVELVKWNLERTKKYEVRTETEGRVAIDAVREFKPDLILLDLVMPDCSGEDVTCQLRQDPELQDIPIIFLTALVTKKEEMSAQDSVIGGNIFLSKPVSFERLIAYIEKILQ